MSQLIKQELEIKSLLTDNKNLRDVFPKFRSTLESLCTCNGVNNLVVCKACKFKHSFNQDRQTSKEIDDPIKGSNQVTRYKLEEDNKKLIEFVTDCSGSHNETRYLYRAKVLLIKMGIKK